MSEEQKAPEEVNAQAQEPSVSIEEAESKAGIKEEAVNQDAVDNAKEPGEQKPAALPSFFIEDDDIIKVEVDILFDKETGNLVSVSRKGLLDENDFDVLGYTAEWFDFKPATYEDMGNYRQRCSVFRRDANQQLVDPVALRNYLIVWHLKDWSIRGRDGKKIELKHKDNGALDDDSIQAVYKLNPTMLDVVLTLFEKDMMM